MNSMMQWIVSMVNWEMLGALLLIVAIGGSVVVVVVLVLSRRNRRIKGQHPPWAPEDALPSQRSSVPRTIAYPSNAPAESEEGSIGRYRLLERLGAGGMGTVYKARDPELDRVVALKLPRFDGLPSEVAKRIQRFQREARAAAKIWNPHVCPIYDVGEHKGQPYVVMALVDGQSLAARLTEIGRFDDIGQAVSLIRQVLDGLDAVHGHGILHRDLKPGNILIDRSGRAILTDFGLARTEINADPITSEGVIVGTPAYMAPEQAGRPEAVGPWTDLYSVGVVFYQMLTGHLPFEGSALEVLAKVLHEPPVPASQHRCDLPAPLQTVISKALSREPSARFATAREFREALGGWQGTRSDSAPISLPTTDWKPGPFMDAGSSRKAPPAISATPFTGPPRDALGASRGAPMAPPIAYAAGQSYAAQAKRAMICSVLGLLVVFLGPAGLILGIVALSGMRHSGNRAGYAMAVTGVVVGIIDILLFLGVFLWAANRNAASIVVPLRPRSQTPFGNARPGNSVSRAGQTLTASP